MKEFVDQMNNTIRLSGIPRRIVSFVPSQTELLFTLGLGDRVVGITKFCIYPKEWFRSKKKVGGTKNVDFEKVKALKPDLIIGNKEENDQSNIEELASIAPIWMSDISNLTDALEMIQKVGDLVGESTNSMQLIADIRLQFDELSDYVKAKPLDRKTPSVLYLIWKNPYLSAGKSTFIDDMISKCGMINYVNIDRYPEVVFDENRAPDIVYLSSEPYPFKEKDIEEIKQIFPKAKVILVDGEMFSWYGSRLIHSPKYFIGLL